MVSIAVDAMGGDHFPKPEVEGSIRAAKTLDVRIILVGDEGVVRRELNQHEGWRELPIEIVHASERISMEDSAAKAARSKKDSSIHVALPAGIRRPGERLRFGRQHRRVHGHLEDGSRQDSGRRSSRAFRCFPDCSWTPAVLLDIGANVDCSPDMLAQFAVMGELYSRIVLKVERPRVGLLSIGEEEHKGNELTRDATPLLKALDINFIGNVEGRDLYTGDRRRDRVRWLHRQCRAEGE